MPQIPHFGFIRWLLARAWLVCNCAQGCGASYILQVTDLIPLIYIYILLLTYLLTPWCRGLPEQLTGLQLVKKFPAFHGTRRFITALTSVRIYIYFVVIHTYLCSWLVTSAGLAPCGLEAYATTVACCWLLPSCFCISDPVMLLFWRRSTSWWMGRPSFHCFNVHLCDILKHEVTQCPTHGILLKCWMVEPFFLHSTKINYCYEWSCDYRHTAYCVCKIELPIPIINPSAWSDGHCPHAARSHSFVYISTS